MKYYMVKTWCADKPIYRHGNGRNTGKVYNSGLYLIAGELFTPAERANMANHAGHFDEIETPKSNTYFSFGARFLIDAERSRKA